MSGEKDAHKLLFVEDDALIASGLIYAFGKKGFAVNHAENIIIKIQE